MWSFVELSVHVLLLQTVYLLSKYGQAQILLRCRSSTHIEFWKKTKYQHVVTAFWAPTARQSNHIAVLHPAALCGLYSPPPIVLERNVGIPFVVDNLPTIAPFCCVPCSSLQSSFGGFPSSTTTCQLLLKSLCYSCLLRTEVVSQEVPAASACSLSCLLFTLRISHFPVVELFLSLVGVAISFPQFVA